MECGKDCKNYCKMEALEPWKSWFCLEVLLKILLPPWSKKLQKWGRKCVQNRMQIYKIPFWAQGRKDNKKSTQKTTQIVLKNIPQG